jgi:DNA-binding MarR family transcriptional regulator
MAAVSEVVPADGLRNEMGVLVAVANASGLEQKALGAVMALDLTTISQLVDVLERKGFVRRVGSPVDRRSKLVEITRAGQRYVAEHRPRVIKIQNEVLSVLSEAERAALTDMIARVIQANPQYDRPGGGRRAPKAKDD